MKPVNLKTKIFLDSGDPAETRQVIEMLGFLDGQTTNPSLFAKNPEVKARVERGEKFSKEEVYSEYKKIVQEVSSLFLQKPHPALPYEGRGNPTSVSIEVYADLSTPAEEMIRQAREMNTWIPPASCGTHIKLPITRAGLEAAEILAKEGVRLNMTLCFSQEQAAAVYAVTRGVKKGQVYLSPFIGRFDDRGEDGMSFIANVINMYRAGDGHVEILSASVRTYQHFLRCLQLQSDIVTAPAKILSEWAFHGCELPAVDWQYDSGGLIPLNYQSVDLDRPWPEYDLKHELTDKGLEKFAADWNNLVKSS